MIPKCQLCWYFHAPRQLRSNKTTANLYKITRNKLETSLLISNNVCKAKDKEMSLNEWRQDVLSSCVAMSATVCSGEG